MSSSRSVFGCLESFVLSCDLLMSSELRYLSRLLPVVGSTLTWIRPLSKIESLGLCLCLTFYTMRLTDDLPGTESGGIADV